MNAPESRAVVAQAQPTDQAIDLFTARGFDLACRIAKAFSTSDAVPSQFRAVVEKKVNGRFQVVENPAAIGNCIVAIETARAVGMSITSVMQQANVIEGKLSWSAQFVIGAINASGRFTPLQFDMVPRGRVRAKYKVKGAWNDDKRGFDFTEKEIEIDDIQCTAWAYARDRGAVTTRKVFGAPVSMKMAVEEGWYGKAGSKWQGEMAHLMLTYRAGAFFGRIHAPDIVMGMGSTAEELRDTIDITPESSTAVADVAPATAPPQRTVEIVERSDPESHDHRDEPQDAPAPPVKAEEPPKTAEPPAAKAPENDPPWSDELQPSASAPMHGSGFASAGAPQSDAATADAASPGEKQNLKQRVAAKGVDMRMLLDTIGATDVPDATLNGLTKEQFKAAKARLA